jgi:dihydroneopterin aldolase
VSGEPIRIELRGLRAFGPHGVTAAEREVGRLIVLDITLTVPDCTAVADDELAGTIDYGAVARIATGVVTGTSCRTLERLCGVIADRLAADLGAEEIEVRAAKTEPPIPEAIDEVAVGLRRPGRAG